MKIKNILLSAVIISSLATTATTAFAENSSTTTSKESLNINQDNTEASSDASMSESVSESSTEESLEIKKNITTASTQTGNVIDSEGVTNELENGEELTHTPQTDYSAFDSPSSQVATYTTNTQQSFIASIAPSAQQIANENDLYASVMIAQAIVESGWGQSTLSTAPNYNLFGIKGSYNGQSVIMPTSEYVNGQWITVNAAFRKYPSYAESLQDNANILKTTSFQSGVYYYSGAWKSNTNSYKDATAWLTGRYATAPNYGDTLNNVIETYQLTQYDSAPNSAVSPMYRLYNKHTGEHFYTLNANEKNYLPTIGWQYEGIAWQAPNSGQPVYRLYNPYSGDHHYTMTQSEINSLTKIGWRYEGLSFYSGGSNPVYRLFNPNEETGTHHYTLSSVERDLLTPLGWIYEGIGFYAS